MAEQNSSADWLPPGWTVDVRVRKNGKKDKCYTDPSNGLKFFSKLEVFRYLNKIETSNPKSKGKSKGSGEHSAINSPSVAEQLKLADSRTNGRITRNQLSKLVGVLKDEKILESFTGREGTSASCSNLPEATDLEQKEKSDSTTGVFDLAPVVGALPEKPESCSNLPEATDLERREKSDSTTSVFGLAPVVGALPEKPASCSNLPEDADLDRREKSDSTTGVFGLAPVVGALPEKPVSCSNLPEDTDLDRREKSDSTAVGFGLAPVVGALPEKLPQNGVENPGNKRKQLGLNESNNKKKCDLPRRASKRLAGIEIGPIPELKTNNRARRVSARQLDEAETSTTGNLGVSAAPEECAEKTHTVDTADKQVCKILLPPGNLSIPEVCDEKTHTQDNADEKRECTIDLPPENLTIPEENAVQVETDNKADEDPGSPLNFSLNDMWTDPCIEFAIKTLTGAIPIEDENKPDDNLGSSLELPFGDSWGDPCIEFAVKTLTGAIPVDDLSVQDYLQQELITSSETMGDKGLNFSNVGSSNFCHSDVLFQHFDTVEKPQYNQRAVSPDNGHGGLQNSGDADLRPHREEGSEECQRQSIRG